MTRAAVLALRAAGTLRTECPYTITDHVQGRLVAGTTITLRAVSGTELSEQVDVNTTYDNEAWAGIYDIDRALVLELTDNRGNVAKGFNGAEVANFDWGNTAYTGCRVENATWTVTYGSTQQMLRVTVRNSATLITTGFTGSMQDNEFHTAVTANFTGANGSWRYSEWKNGGTFNAAGYTGGGDNYYNEIDSCTVTLGLTGFLVLRNSELQTCNINIQGAANATIQSCEFYSQTISRPATGGILYLAQGSSREAGTTTLSGAAQLSMTGTQNNGSVSITGTGNTAVNYCSIDQSCVVQNAGSGTLNVTRTTLQGISSNITLDAGSSTITVVDDCTLRASGLLRVIGAVGGGNFNVSGTRVDSGSFIYKRHTGALLVAQGVLEGASGIDGQSGDRSYTFTRARLTEVARVNLTGTGAVTDVFNDIFWMVRGAGNISCSGAANNISQCSISGLSGSLSLTGTTGGQVMNRLKCHDGSITFANCPTNITAQLCTAEDAGTIVFTGVAAPKAVQYLHARNQGSITVNNSSGGGTLNGVTVETIASYVVSGQAAGSNRVQVSGGTVSHNGGALTGCFKALSGTLTTGNFNHNQIVHISPTNRALTVANSSRAEYVGLAPGAYTATGALI